MKELCELVAVTYGEFQSWYNYGELRVSADRLVYLEQDADGKPDPDSAHTVLLTERFPQLSLEDEEGVLIVQLAASSVDLGRLYGTPPMDVRTVYLPVDRVKRVIPLTDRAARILEPRLSALGVRLDPAILQQPVREAWYRMGVRRSMRGGDALVNLHFRCVDDVVGGRLREAAQEGVWALDHSGDQPAEGPHSKRVAGSTWVSDAFSYTRHTPYPNGPRDLGYVIDAGVALKTMAIRRSIDDGFLEPFRAAMKKARDRFTSASRLPEILQDHHLKDVAALTREKLPEAFPAGLGALVAFLYWKDAFHRNGQEIPFSSLRRELQDFASSLGFEETIAAVWLLGCFAGFERVAPALYAAHGARFPWYSGDVLAIEKIDRPIASTAAVAANPVADPPNPEEEQTGSASGCDQGDDAGALGAASHPEGGVVEAPDANSPIPPSETAEGPHTLEQPSELGGEGEGVESTLESDALNQKPASGMSDRQPSTPKKKASKARQRPPGS